MEINEIQTKACQLVEEYNKKNNIKHNKDTVFHHLIEEIGELAKELYHEKNNWRAEFNKERFENELIDVLMQLLILAKDYEVNIEEAFNKKLTNLKERFELNY